MERDRLDGHPIRIVEPVSARRTALIVGALALGWVVLYAGSASLIVSAVLCAFTIREVRHHPASAGWAG